MISTHTLTWSVTKSNINNKQMYKNFNSHAHVERDVGGSDVTYEDSDFNSHAHVERDL